MKIVTLTVGILALSMNVAACVENEKKPGVIKMDSLYMFRGVDGAMAYSIDKAGANLPSQYAPWRFVQQVSTDGPTFKAGTDKEALEVVKAQGFWVIVWSMTIEDSELDGE